METIHLKSADPFSQQLLRLAAQRGIDLPWERYEKGQPQDGFMRLGLNCPFECMHGPCRIDPFGRGPSLGICGLDREQMVAATVLRLSLQGARQALNKVPHCAAANDLTPSGVLGSLINKALSARQQAELSCLEVLETSGLLQRGSHSYEELLHQALRLGLLTLALVEQADSSQDIDNLECSSGYGVIQGAPVRIAFSGQPDRDLADALEQEIASDPERPALLLSLGEWLQLDGSFMPIAVPSGEAELLLSSGSIHFLIAGPGTDPGILRTCEKAKVPVLADWQAGDAGDILRRARTQAGQAQYPDLFGNVPARQSIKVIMSASSFTETLASDSTDELALIGGSDTPHLSLGSLAGELFAGLTDRGIKVAGWGDTALWMARLSPKDASGEQPLTLEKSQGPLLAVKGLAESRRLDTMKGICFSGMRDVQEFSMALGLAYLGCRVSIATPIPLQGSRIVKDTLSQMIEENGGELLHFDYPAGADKLVDWLTAA